MPYIFYTLSSTSYFLSIIKSNGDNLTTISDYGPAFKNLNVSSAVWNKNLNHLVLFKNKTMAI